MKKKIFVNLLGKFWSVFSVIIFIPLYIKYLGIESYSIISFSLILIGVVSVLDSGLSASISREFASASNTIHDKQRIFHSLETVYVIICLIAFISLFSCSKLIADNWIQVKSIESKSIITCIKIISLEISLRLISNFYYGGLIGLDLHVINNALQIIYSFFRNGIVVLVIYFNGILEYFFYWQLASTIIFVIVSRFFLIKALGRKTFFLIPAIEKKVISKIQKFAGGMMLIALVGALNTQLDKISLSALLPIEVLGFYTVSFTLANGLILICTPIATAYLPKMTLYYSNFLLDKSKTLFVSGQKLISLILFSTLVMFIFFPREIIWIWTNDFNVASSAFNYLPWLSIGATFLGLQVLPFNIAIANGYTKLNNILGLISLILTIPGYWFMTLNYKGSGASLTFAIIHIASGLIYIYLINKKFLKFSFKFLFGTLLFKPLIVSLAVAYSIKSCFELTNDRFILVFQIAIYFLLLLFFNTLVLYWTDCKNFIKTRFRKIIVV